MNKEVIIIQHCKHCNKGKEDRKPAVSTYSNKPGKLPGGSDI